MSDRRPSPPGFFLTLFRRFCHPEMLDYIEGDLMEVYESRLKTEGKRKADVGFIVDVILLFRPGIIRSVNGFGSVNTLGMYKNYLKISLRNLLRHKAFTLITVSGLTLGLLSFIFITLYIQDELSYDLFRKDSERMYRVLQHESSEDGTVRNLAAIAGLIGKESAAAFPEIEDYCRFSAYGRITMGNDPASRSYYTTLTADPNFLSFFGIPLIEGTPEGVFKHPDEVVISENLARKFFGEGPALGKRIWSSLIKGGLPGEFTVVGVMENFPKTHTCNLISCFPKLRGLDISIGTMILQRQTGPATPM